MEMVNENQYFKAIEEEYLKSLPIGSFSGKIYVVDHPDSFNEARQDLAYESILGFDTETRPSFRKGHKNKVSLIQLSTDDLACLFRINKIGIPKELIDILADPEIIKVGVAVHDDLRFLKKVKKFNPEGFIDLQNFVKDFGIKSSGLKKLTAIILGFRISKRQQVTDWEADVLTEAQQVYAATDAWVCRQIYEKLIRIN